MNTINQPADYRLLWTFIKVIMAVSKGDSSSMLDMRIVPGTKTPPHVHHQFSETFTVLSGELAIGLGHQCRTLRTSDSATVPTGISHFFANQSSTD